MWKYPQATAAKISSMEGGYFSNSNNSCHQKQNALLLPLFKGWIGIELCVLSAYRLRYWRRWAASCTLGCLILLFRRSAWSITLSCVPLEVGAFWSLPWPVRELYGGTFQGWVTHRRRTSWMPNIQNETISDVSTSQHVLIKTTGIYQPSGGHLLTTATQSGSPNNYVE